MRGEGIFFEFFNLKRFISHYLLTYLLSVYCSMLCTDFTKAHSLFVKTKATKLIRILVLILILIQIGYCVPTHCVDATASNHFMCLHDVFLKQQQQQQRTVIM